MILVARLPEPARRITTFKHPQKRLAAYTIPDHVHLSHQKACQIMIFFF